jgi:DNA-binding HxlR family transcriptional regulator
VLKLNNRLVSTTILEALGRNGAQKVDELFKQVQKFHGDLDRRFFDESLMALELQGLVTVYSMARDQRRVELAKG